MRNVEEFKTRLKTFELLRERLLRFNPSGNNEIHETNHFISITTNWIRNIKELIENPTYRLEDYSKVTRLPIENPVYLEDKQVIEKLDRVDRNVTFFLLSIAKE